MEQDVGGNTCLRLCRAIYSARRKRSEGKWQSTVIPQCVSLRIGTVMVNLLFGLLKLNICLSIFIDYDLGDQHPLILILVSQHEFHHLLTEDASRQAAPIEWVGW